MPKFDIAHINQQGIDLIIVPLSSHFGSKGASDQRSAVDELQARASAAGLKGTVVPVWDAGGGRMGFIAPQSWHPYFMSINLDVIAANINRQLYW